MKTYVAVTAIVFALIVLAHVLRAFLEGPHVAHDPWFLAFTAVAVVLLAWAVRELVRARRS